MAEVGSEYTDERGTWKVTAVTADGQVSRAVLYEGRESQEFRDEHAARVAAKDAPDPEQDAIDAFAAGDDTQQTDALRAMAKRQASA